MKGKLSLLMPIYKCLYTSLMFHLMDLSEAAKKSKQKIAIASIYLILQNFIAIHGK
jgi:hypothetical protein